MNYSYRIPTVGRFFVTCLAVFGTLAAFELRAVINYEPYTFTTFAGGGIAFYLDGVGTAARLNNPRGLVTDSSGNIYVTDESDATIRKIAPDGTVTTFAGSPGNFDSVDGTLDEAMFGGPTGLVFDSAGNMIVVDQGNSTIRKITPAGVVTTIAGQPWVQGSANGTGTNATFSTPMGIAIDQSDNLYIADPGNHTIRKMTHAGVVTTFAGQAGVPGSQDGTGTAATFNQPMGVAVDALGNVYVADSANSVVRKITPSRVVTTFAGQGGEIGLGTPAGIATDASGNIYVADLYENSIFKITPSADFSLFAGVIFGAGSDDGDSSVALFFGPQGVTVDSSGNVLVADGLNNTIRKIATDGQVSTVAGRASEGSNDGTGIDARFYYPQGIATDNSGNVYVADTQNFTIRKITSVGVVTTFAGTPGSYGFADGTGSAASFINPGGLATDASGNLYVADMFNEAIRKITPDGAVTTLAGGTYGSDDGTGRAAGFKNPAGVATDGAGNVYVADTYNHTIRKVTSDGVVTTLAGLAGTTGNGDGNGSAARFNHPMGVAVDASNNVYVADFYNFTIRKITPAGDVTTFAGTAGVRGHNDGTGSAATFSYPSSVATDSSGNVYVTDEYNYVIRKITPDGVVTTLGTSDQVFTDNADGSGTQWGWNQPVGITLDSFGNIYVADTYNNAIRKGSAVPCPPISLSPPTLPRAAAGAYNQSITASGGGAPYVYSVAGGALPPGLNLSTYGTLSGTPTVGGTYNFIVAATDTNGCSGSSNYSIIVNCPTITFSPSTLPNGTLAGYNQHITAGGGVAPYTYALTGGSVPGGLALASDGTLSGLPLGVSTNTFTVTATDAQGCTGNTSYTLVIGGSGNPLDTNGPVLGSILPHDKAEIIGSAGITVSGTAKDSKGIVKTSVALVLYSLNGAAPQLATTANKFTNWTANVTLAPGWNTFTVQAIDLRGNASTVNCAYYYGTLTNATGAYQGIFFQTDDNGAPTIAVPSAGTLSVTVTKQRTYSGKVYVNGVTYLIGGTFDFAGNSSATVHRAPSKPDLAVDLHLDWTGASKEMTGTVSCAGESWTSPLVAIWTFKGH